MTSQFGMKQVKKLTRVSTKKRIHKEQNWLNQIRIQFKKKQNSQLKIWIN